MDKLSLLLSRLSQAGYTSTDSLTANELTDRGRTDYPLSFLSQIANKAKIKYRYTANIIKYNTDRSYRDHAAAE